MRSYIIGVSQLNVIVVHNICVPVSGVQYLSFRNPLLVLLLEHWNKLAICLSNSNFWNKLFLSLEQELLQQAVFVSGTVSRVLQLSAVNGNYSNYIMNNTCCIRYAVLVIGTVRNLSLTLFLHSRTVTSGTVLLQCTSSQSAIVSSGTKMYFWVGCNSNLTSGYLLEQFSQESGTVLLCRINFWNSCLRYEYQTDERTYARQRKYRVDSGIPNLVMVIGTEVF